MNVGIDVFVSLALADQYNTPDRYVGLLREVKNEFEGKPVNLRTTVETRLPQRNLNTSVNQPLDQLLSEDARAKLDEDIRVLLLRYADEVLFKKLSDRFGKDAVSSGAGLSKCMQRSWANIVGG